MNTVSCNHDHPEDGRGHPPPEPSLSHSTSRFVRWSQRFRLRWLIVKPQRKFLHILSILPTQSTYNIWFHTQELTRFGQKCVWYFIKKTNKKKQENEFLSADCENDIRCVFTNLDESLHSAGHGELLAVRRPRLLRDGVLWQAPSLLHHQLLADKSTDFTWTKVRQLLTVIMTTFNPCFRSPAALPLGYIQTAARCRRSSSLTASCPDRER